MRFIVHYNNQIFICQKDSKTINQVLVQLFPFRDYINQLILLYFTTMLQLASIQIAHSNDGTTVFGLLAFWATVLNGKSTNTWSQPEIKIHYCFILSQCAYSFSIPMVSQGSTMPTSLFALSLPDSPTENFHLSGTSNFWK